MLPRTMARTKTEVMRIELTDIKSRQMKLSSFDSGGDGGDHADCTLGGTESSRVDRSL